MTIPALLLMEKQDSFVVRAVRSTVDYDTETKKLIILPEPQDPITKVEKQWKEIEDIDTETEDMETCGMLNAG